MKSLFQILACFAISASPLYAEFGLPMRPSNSGQAFDGHVVYRAIAAQSTSSSNYVAVGRAWNGTHYVGIIKSSLVNYGFPNGSFLASSGWNPGEQFYDFSGAGLDNLCAAVVYAYDGFIVACRSEKATGDYDIYLVKVDASGNLMAAFGTGGIVDTGLGGSSNQALVRGIAYNPDVNVSDNGVVAIVGAIGNYSPGVFHPFIAAYDQHTGALYSSSVSDSNIAGTAVGVAYDHTSVAYYVASTETTGPNHFYVERYYHDGTTPTTIDVDSTHSWDTAVNFTTAISDQGASSSSIPSNLAVYGSDVYVAGANRVNSASPPWRCAVVALQTSNGTVDTTFGTVPLTGGTNDKGISLFSHEVTPTDDCIVNQIVPTNSGSDLFLTGTAYAIANGNYDYLTAVIQRSSGALLATYGSGTVAGTETFGLGPADDVLNATTLVNSGSYLVAVGRSTDASGYQGADAEYFNVSTGGIAATLSSLSVSAEAHLVQNVSVPVSVLAKFSDASTASIPASSFNWTTSNGTIPVPSGGTITPTGAASATLTAKIAGVTNTLDATSYADDTLILVAGNTAGGYTNGSNPGGDGVIGTGSFLGFTNDGVAADATGNLYIADTTNNRVQMIAKISGSYFGQSMTAGLVYTIAGSSSGTAGSTGNGGPATSALLHNPVGVALDGTGNLYISDNGNSRIQMVPNGPGIYYQQAMTQFYMYTIAGTAGSSGSTGDGGLATSALLNAPTGIAANVNGVYFADTANQRIQMVARSTATYFGISMTAGYIYTIAGTTGSSGNGGDGVAATSSLLLSPYGVAIDSSDNLFIADTGNNRIQMVPATSATYFGQAMTANYIYTVAGSAPGYSGNTGDGGAATSARLNAPRGVATDANGHLYIADTSNNRVQMVAKTSGTFFGQSMTANDIYTIAGSSTGSGGYTGDGAIATSALLHGPWSVAVDATRNLAIADTVNARIQYVPQTTQSLFQQSMTADYMYTIAGSTEAYIGLSGDGGAATSALFNIPESVSVDSSGNIYVADTSNNRIQMIPQISGTYFGQAMTAYNVYTIAGSSVGTSGSTGNGGLATSALLSGPYGVFIDSSGNLYIADTGNNRVQMVPATSGTYFTQNMTANYMYTLATGATTVVSVAADSSGNYYYASGNQVFMGPKANGTYFGQTMFVTARYSIAGNTSAGSTGDGGIATSGYLHNAGGVYVDTSGNVYIADTGNARVQMVPKTSGTYFGQTMTAAYMYTIAGTTGSLGNSGDGGPATSALLDGVYSVAVDSSGNLFISDTGNSRIQMVPAASGTYFGQSMTANYIYTVAGSTGYSGNYGYSGLAKSALLNYPYGIALDSFGNLFLVEDYGITVQIFK